MIKVLVLATYDSFLRTGLEVAKAIENALIDIKIRTTVDNQLSPSQLKSIFGESDYTYSYFVLNEYKNIDYNQYDIIILSAGNGFVQSFFEFYLQNGDIKRENIITMSLFPGVIFGDIDSISVRMSADILLCNNQIDFEIAQKVKETYQLPTKLLLYGYPIIKQIKQSEPKNIYFFEQVKIPETYSDRMYLLHKIMEYAQRNPEEMIYIKPRVAPNEKTVHINKYPLEKLLKEYAKTNDISTNFSFTYQDIEACFSDMKLGITLSSTVAIEAIYNQLPMSIIADFGLRSDFANKDFLGSGILVLFDDLGSKELKVNNEWYQSMVFFPENRQEILNSLIFELRETKRLNFFGNIIGTETSEYILYKKIYDNIKLKKRILKVIKNPSFLVSILKNLLIRKVVK